MSQCNHVVCVAVADGECHISDDGWLVNVSTEQMEIVGKVLGWPQDPLALAIRKNTKIDLAAIARGWLDDPAVCSTDEDRKRIEGLLEGLRKQGIPKSR